MIVEISWSRVASWILKISGRISALSGEDAKLAYLYFWGVSNISKSSQDLKRVPHVYFPSNFIGLCKKHCQRHNGPEGWVLLTKETSSYTNLDQIPKFKIFRPNFNIKILTKHSLHNLTKPQQQNTDQTSVSKVSLELQLQTLGQTLCSKSEQNLALWPNFSFQNCIKLSSKRFSSSTSATVTNSTSFELASSQATRHINQVY